MNPLAEITSMPGHLVRRVHQISTAIFNEELGRLDLTSVQFAALVAISESDALDATRLAEAIALDRATTGGVVERLEAKRLVERVSNPRDKRVRLLRITPAGRSLAATALQRVRIVQQRLLEPLPEPAQRTLTDLLSQLVSAHAATATDSGAA